MSTQPTSNDTLRIVLLVLAVIVLGPMLMMALAFPMIGMWGGGMMGGFGGTAVSPLWGIVMSLVWLVVLFGGGYLVYRWATGAGGVGDDPAVEELRLAYARGDLTDEEFAQRRSKLEEE